MENLETTVKEINKQYNEMVCTKIPMFEIASDTIEDEYYIYNINIDNTGLWTQPYNDNKEILRVDFDSYFDDLGYYLNELCDLCMNDILEYENSLNKQYNEMLCTKIPMFEIASDTIEDEYYIYNINIDNTGLWTQPYNDNKEILRVDFDSCFDDLGYYLNELCDLCMNDINEYENSLNN